MGALEFFCAECSGSDFGVAKEDEQFQVRLVEFNGSMHVEMGPLGPDGEVYVAILSKADAKGLADGLEAMMWRCADV